MQQLAACPGIDELGCHWLSVTDGKLCGHCCNLHLRRARKAINARKRVDEKQQRRAIQMIQLTQLMTKANEQQKRRKQDFDNLVANLRAQSTELAAKTPKPTTN
jgi:hypothetical protein